MFGSVVATAGLSKTCLQTALPEADFNSSER
jgi:hypothetical protein